MNEDFPRIVTLLRKERGLSQKQAALELGVSQALLSHYEKGIRECGLAFVVKVADYYNVSCDYLLGRTADRHGATLKLDDVSEQPQENDKQSSSKTTAMIKLNKRLVMNLISILFDLLEQSDSKALTGEISSYLMVSVYKMVRTLYSANPKNPQAMFSVIPEIYSGLSSAMESITEANARCLASGKVPASLGDADVPIILSMSSDVLSKNYPELAPSLYNLIQKTEERMKNIEK